MIKLTGDDVKGVMNLLPLHMNHRLMQAANAAAATPLIHAAHRMAPVGKTAHLAESIGTEKPGMSRAGEIGEVRVGPRRGRFHGNHGHLVEYGTGQRTTKSGANRGAMPAKPFMAPAFQQTREAVLSGINKFLGEKVASFCRRTLKRGHA